MKYTYLKRHESYYLTRKGKLRHNTVLIPDQVIENREEYEDKNFPILFYSACRTEYARFCYHTGHKKTFVKLK